MTNQGTSQFQSYGISENVLEALELLGYHQPTDIQEKVIPILLSGNNVVVKAPTGSGKTAAFGIPICNKIIWEENPPQGLVLEPTRELAVQVKDEIFHIGRKKRLKVPAVYGGVPIDQQIRSLKQKSHIVVGTPGRVMDLIRRENLNLDHITYVVIDEADLMLDMGFIDEVKEILALISKGCQISLFSATLEPRVMQLAKEYIQNASFIEQTFAEQESMPPIVQKVYEVEEDNKYKVFINILIEENPESCIIFCGTREMVNVLFQKLRRSRIFCGMIHGELEQKERLKTLDAFRRGCFRFLIATDVAARGIDIENMTHVIQYDFPTGKETYVHRTGRTGRNGFKGTAISLVSEEEKRMLRIVEGYIGQTLPMLESPKVSKEKEKEFWKNQRSRGEKKPKKGASLNKGILCLAIGGGKKSKMRAGDIVGTICSIEGIEESDIGIIDIRDSLSYVEILNHKGEKVLECLQTKPVKGKVRKVRITRNLTNG